jgi:hypothetical protein
MLCSVIVLIGHPKQLARSLILLSHHLLELLSFLLLLLTTLDLSLTNILTSQNSYPLSPKAAFFIFVTRRLLNCLNQKTATLPLSLPILSLTIATLFTSVELPTQSISAHLKLSRTIPFFLLLNSLAPLLSFAPFIGSK